MAFLPASGKVQTEYFPKTASTAIGMGAALEFDGSGTVNPADSSDTTIAGVSQRAVTSTDSDYASETPTAVWMLTPDLEFYADVVTGTATIDMIGNSYNLGTSLGIDVTAQTHPVFTITQFLSATKVRGRFNGSYMFRNAA